MSKLIFFLASPYVQSEVSLALEGGVHGLVAEAAHLDEASRQARVTVWNLADTPCREISVRADEEAAGDALASNGKLIIGTVEGDLHDIGKNLVAMMVAAGAPIKAW